MKQLGPWDWTEYLISSGIEHTRDSNIYSPTIAGRRNASDGEWEETEISDHDSYCIPLFSLTAALARS